MNNKAITQASQLLMKLRRQRDLTKVFWDQAEPVWRSGMRDAAERIAMGMPERMSYTALRKAALPRSSLSGLNRQIKDLEAPKQMGLFQ